MDLRTVFWPIPVLHVGSRSLVLWPAAGSWPRRIYLPTSAMICHEVQPQRSSMM